MTEALRKLDAEYAKFAAERKKMKEALKKERGVFEKEKQNFRLMKEELRKDHHNFPENIIELNVGGETMSSKVYSHKD
jgi:hypothetical protein